MKILINGNIGRTYCENLCLIFFPGEKFPEDDFSGNVAEITLAEKDGNAFSAVKIVYGDKSAEGSALCPLSEKRAEKIAVGRAVLNAGSALRGGMPPWGILTGVRPAKLSNGMADAGFGREEIISCLTEEYSVSEEKAKLLATVTEEERHAFSLASEDTCSVYVSVPFCPTRCAYCSFVSYSTPGYLSLIPDYVEALLEDIDETFRRASDEGKKVLSVYIGGGTPTVLNEKQLDKVLSWIEKNLSAPLLEFTVEAGRPDTVNSEKFDIMLSHGVNRTSINPQILDDGILRKIGRNHTITDFYRAYETARKSGIGTVNTDLIAGLPGSDREIFGRTLDGIIALEPENVTVHTFCVKKSATFTEKARVGSTEKIYSFDGGDTPLCVSDSQRLLGENGYRPYYLYRQKNASGNLENVGFTKPGHTGLYNIFIMEELHNIYACGAGAVTKITDTPDGKIRREFTPKYTYEYLDRRKK